ncbi:MAG: YggS family pyridoxal phosphate-dependent enzyme [Candidatus Cloacimonetes bacterium]|nr:YggS family pyridoxal phosphate-dependent enzyme [Candidatus Cloacimonadota bacterium]
MDIRERLKEVEERIAKSAERAGSSRSQIKLLAVTKTHSVEIIREALAAGVEYIGENKVQEAELKIPQLKGLYKEFHYIGHLQANKINKLLALEPELIHSIDDLALVEKLNARLATRNRMQDILLQVNTSGEESKFGIAPQAALETAGKINQYSNVRLCGLMTIGKFTDNETELRGSFRLLRELRDQLSSFYPELELKWLSMGMSNDFEIAIEEGANLLRLGTVLFGLRACAIRN